MAATATMDVRKRPDVNTPCIHDEFNLTASGRLITEGELVLMGWALYEVTNANPATILFYDSESATGNPVFPVTLLKNESSRETWAPRGVWIRRGLYANVTSGQVEGSIFWLPAAR